MIRRAAIGVGPAAARTIIYYCGIQMPRCGVADVVLGCLMKLKNVLLLAFVLLTLVPTSVISALLYKSGTDLSKESYERNLEESINVQVDYISQIIDNKMISDSRFVKKLVVSDGAGGSAFLGEGKLLEQFQNYLEASEDEMAVCLLVNADGKVLYSIGEGAAVDTVRSNLPAEAPTAQAIEEFKLAENAYSLGVVTPVLDSAGKYAGSLVSVYDKSYIFKSISSYYKLTDTATYVCRTNGDVINSRKFTDEQQNDAVAQALKDWNFQDEAGFMDMKVEGVSVTGYYKNIHGSEWYLAGFLDDNLIYSFANQFILPYVAIILVIVAVAMILSFCISRKVVEPINALIYVMDRYKSNLDENELKCDGKAGYFETQYLQNKFFSLMRTIKLVRHNFDGVYQLYQSSDMGDINIDIDVKEQVASSNKPEFQDLMDGLEVPEGACVVERFTRCFADQDQRMLMGMLENMRDEHLSVKRESVIYTPYLGQKWFHSLIVPMYEDDRLSRLFVQLRDVSSYKKTEQESINQARKDELTGLLNRYGFVEGVNSAMAEADEPHSSALLFVDMNYFKMVNDNFGHSAGDDLLRKLSEDIAQTVGDKGITARLGGDEFAVFLPRCTQAEAEELKLALRRKLVYPFITGDVAFEVSASIGVAVRSADSQITLDELLRSADADMYVVKREIKADDKNSHA